MAFLAISDRYATLICLEIFDKMAAVGHFGCPKFTFDRISGHFRSIRNFNFDKMGAVGHFGCPKFTFDRISGHLLSIRNFNFDKMTAAGHFGCPKLTFDRISGHFRSIRILFFWAFFLQNGCHRPFWMPKIHFRSHFWPFQIYAKLNFFWKFLTKWLPPAILGVRNSLSIAFLAILDQYGIFIYFLFFTKWPPADILDVRKSLLIAFLAISDRSDILDV